MQYAAFTFRKFAGMTEEEKSFISYWEANRDKQKRFFKQLAIGLPAGAIFGIALFLNFIVGWSKQASILLRSYPHYRSLILVLLIAVIMIVVFIAVFSVKVRWERNEQRYKELLTGNE